MIVFGLNFQMSVDPSLDQVHLKWWEFFKVVEFNIGVYGENNWYSFPYTDLNYRTCSNLKCEFIALFRLIDEFKLPN